MTRKTRLGHLPRQRLHNSTRLRVGRGKAGVCLKTAWHGQFCDFVIAPGRFAGSPGVLGIRLGQRAVGTWRISALFIPVSVWTECLS
jgi:hypothetical protein